MVRDSAARLHAPHTQPPVGAVSSSKGVKGAVTVSQKKIHPPYIPASTSPSSSPSSTSSSSSASSLAPAHPPGTSTVALTNIHMQGALSALKGKQKKNAKAVVAFGASSPTLRDPVPTPTATPLPIPINLEEQTPSHTVRLCDSTEKEINGSKKRSDSTQNAKAGRITTPVTTDRWRAKSRGYSTVPNGSKTGRMDPNSPCPGVSAQMPVTGTTSASPVHSIEMSAAQRLAVWSALLVLQSSLIGCEDTQRLTAEFGLHEPLAALLKLASNWGSIISLLSSPLSAFISSSHSLKRKNLSPAAWCPSQFHVISTALAASCAFTSSSSSGSSSSSSSSPQDARGIGRFVRSIIFLCVYHIILCLLTLSHRILT